jgi:hypothetical protein
MKPNGAGSRPGGPAVPGRPGGARQKMRAYRGRLAR